MQKKTEQHWHRGNGIVPRQLASWRAAPRDPAAAAMAGGQRLLELPYPLAWLRARCWCSTLDSALAAGADPAASRSLALRAARLALSRERERTAASLEGAMAEAIAPPRGLSSRIPVDRAQVLSARPFLDRLVFQLREAERPSPQGLAQARLIVGDGGGPLYARDYAGALARLAWRACDALEAPSMPAGTRPS